MMPQRRNVCSRPFRSAFVAVDGETVPCCFGLAMPSLGQVGPDLWQGEGYRSLRKAHLQGRPPDVCRGCRMGRLWRMVVECP